MTIDKVELKALAEAANAVIGDVRVAMTITSEPGPNQAEIDAVTAFMVAARPFAILAMLAESDRLTAQVKTLQSDANSWQSGYDEGRRIGTKTALDERAQLKTANEAIKADIESWRLSLEAERRIAAVTSKALSAEIDRLTGPGFAEELAALRKDAERYRWLRSRESSEDPQLSVTRWTQLTPDRATGEAPRLEVLDAAIDAAMGQGELS